LILELENLTVRYGKRNALDGVSYQFPGGLMGLLGVNGAGKTTLIRAVLGLVTPRCGGGKVLGMDIAKQPLAIRKRVGYMPENDCHIPGMTGIGLVAYAGQLSGMLPKDSVQRAHEVLQYAGLGEARYRNVETYSTGMRQRVKLAQALVHDPDLVFLDEPTNGLDPNGRSEMLALIKDIGATKGISVVLSSHLLRDVESVCEHVLVIDKGRKLEAGRISDLRRQIGAVYDCRLKGDKSAFVEELAKLGCRSLDSEEGSIRIHMADGLGSRTILLVAHKQRAQVRHLVPLKRTLEDVFLQVVGDSRASS
jgi:ABC-2 type transport system ATP-binding protein